MKRLVCLLCTLLLLGAAHTALGFDLSPYRMDADRAVPVSTSEIVTVTSDETAHHVRLLRDGEVVREATLKNENNRIAPLVLEGGRVVLVANEHLAYTDSNEYYRVWYEGGPGPEIPWDSATWGPWACGNALYDLERAQSGSELVILDLSGRELARRRIAGREDRFARLEACVADTDSTYLTAVQYENNAGTEHEVLLERISARGKVIWQTMLEEECRYSTSCLTGDGKGGAYLLAQDAADYKRARLMRLDATGRLLWSKLLTAEGLIFGNYSGYWDEETDCLVLYAYAISKSKGVNDLVRLTISGEGEILSVSAKDFPERKHVGFSVSVTEDRAVFVGLDTRDIDPSGGAFVFLPASVLPDVTPPVFTLE